MQQQQQQQNIQLKERMDKLIQEENFADAIECFSPVLASDPNNPVKLHLMGDLYKNKGDLVQAESYFRRSIKANPKDLGPYLNMALMFSADENYKEAEKVLKKAIKVAPRSALLHGHLGAILQDQNRLKESMEEMELIVSLDSVTATPGDTAIYVDVNLTNPQDSVAAFSLLIQLSNPDLVEFGMSPDDTIAIDVVGTLMEGWEFIHQQSIGGTYHDIRIVAMSNTIPPYANSIPPGYDRTLPDRSFPAF